jgi:hypothetical protein
MDTFSDSNLTMVTETQSSLMFTVGSGRPGTTKPISRRTIRPVGPGFGTDRLGPHKGPQATSKGIILEARKSIETEYYLRYKKINRK